MQREIEIADTISGNFVIKVEGQMAEERFIVNREELLELMQACQMALDTGYAYIVNGRVFR